ncbi:MAG TPA: beta-galactosidase trimerization domain-containing protein [Anaerolineaceae bacterium]
MSTNYANSGWFDRPMRWAQLTLAENDPAPGQYDVDFWLDYFKRAKCDAACLSAGGCVCFYPTKIPFHYKSPFMGDRDAFGELYEGCRKLGMVVIARTDPHAIHQDAYEAHPEWVMVGPDGAPRKHWASPDLWVTCALGPYNFEYMTEVTKEIVSMYKVDGIFSNRWAGHGICYCESCKRLFKQASGMDLPRSRDLNDPARKAYILWYQERLFELWKVWDDAIRAINPQARYIANAGGGALSGLDMKRIGEIADTLFADRQARHGLNAAWVNGKNGKEYRATLGRKAIGGIFSMGVEELYRWKDSVQNPAEVIQFVSDGVANGLRPWFTKFCGMIYDPRWLKPVADLYNKYADWEPYLRNEAPVARIAMVYSQQTAQFYGGEKAHQKVEDHTLGFYEALIGARLPFEMVHDRLMDAEHLKPFKTLILPNIAALSDEQCEQLRAFVRQGGSLVATHETSLYDEMGVRRPNFGLADLFGVDYQDGPVGPQQNAYLAIERDPNTRLFHPLVAGLEDAGRIINGVNWIHVKGREAYPNPPLTLIPSYPDLPMEMVWVREPKTDIPGVYVRKYGEGRVVYFPWDVDRTFWEVRCLDHEALLVNAVQWATNEIPPVTVEGPGILDVTVWLQKQSMTVHLVNLTNPAYLKAPVKELMAVGGQTVRVQLPEDRKVAAVRLLAAGRQVPYCLEGNRLVVEVPSILVHEVVAVDFTPL